MGAMASQITGIWTACWAVYSETHRRRHQSSAPLASVGDRWIPLTKGGFANNFFKCFFWKEMFVFVIRVSLKIVPKDVIDNNLALFYVMHRFQKLHELMITKVKGMPHHGPLTRYVKLQVAHAPGMPGTFSPAADFKENRLLAIPACITARASRTCRDACRDRLHAVTGKTFPAFPAHAHPQFYVSGKRPMLYGIIIYLLQGINGMASLVEPNVDKALFS